MENKDKPMLVKNIVRKLKEKMGACPSCGSIVFDCYESCWNCYQAITFEEKNSESNNSL